MMERSSLRVVSPTRYVTRYRAGQFTPILPSSLFQIERRDYWLDACLGTMNKKTFWLLGWCLIFSPGSLRADADVHALFDLATPTTGPFPSDWFTVPDARQNTRRRVNLPLPDCAVRQSDCEDLAVINTLDGFNLQPRLSIPFDGAIDVATVSSNTVFLISLGSALRDGEDESASQCGGKESDDDCGRVVGINQV